MYRSDRLDQNVSAENDSDLYLGRGDSCLHDAEELLASWRLLVALGGSVADVKGSLEEGVEVPAIGGLGHALKTLRVLRLVCCNSV